MTTKTERMAYGIERCHTCGWKNIFYADKGEIQPQLIASINPVGWYVCPKCRSDNCSRHVFAEPMPVSIFFLEKQTPSVSDAVEPRTKMTFRQHCRAFARWCTPWADDGQIYLLLYTMLLVALGLVTAIFGDWSTVRFSITMLVVLWAAVLAWRVIVTILWAGGYIYFEGRSKTEMSQQWYEFGQKPLFPYLQHQTIGKWRFKRYMKKRRESKS